MKGSDTTKKSGTDWERLRRMKDEDIDVSDIPPLDEAFFKNAVLRMPENKRAVSLRLDADVPEALDVRARYNAADTARAEALLLALIGEVSEKISADLSPAR